MDCPKVKYASEQAAMEDIKRIQKKSVRGRVPVRAYRCECGAWHITSKQDQLYEKIMELLKENKQLRLDIADLTEKKKREIAELTEKNKQLLQHNDKEERKELKKEGALAALQKGLQTLRDENKNMRKKNNDLIVQIVQLRNLIEKINSEEKE